MKTTLLILGLSFVLLGCCQSVNPEAMALSVNPVASNPVAANPVAAPNPEQCNPVFSNPNPFACGVQCNPTFGCNPADAPATSGTVTACSPFSLKAEDPQMPCGDFPAEAKPGEVWCCVEETTMTAAQVLVTPEHVVETLIPAVYETYTEQVLEQPERTEWVRTDCPADEKAGVPASSECYILKLVPAVYKTETKQRLVTPEMVRMEKKSAVYETVMQTSPPVRVWKRNPACELKTK